MDYVVCDWLTGWFSAGLIGRQVDIVLVCDWLTVWHYLICDWSTGRNCSLWLVETVVWLVEMLILCLSEIGWHCCVWLVDRLVLCLSVIGQQVDTVVCDWLTGRHYVCRPFHRCDAGIRRWHRVRVDSDRPVFCYMSCSHFMCHLLSTSRLLCYRYRHFLS